MNSIAVLFGFFFTMLGTGTGDSKYWIVGMIIMWMGLLKIKL